MVLRLLSRRAVVQIPENVQAMQVQTPGAGVDPAQVVVRCAGRTLPLAPAGDGWSCEPLPVEGDRTVTITLLGREHLDPASVPRRPLGAWPIARRALAQGRDRIMPLTRRRPRRYSRA